MQDCLAGLGILASAIAYLGLCTLTDCFLFFLSFVTLHVVRFNACSTPSAPLPIVKSYGLMQEEELCILLTALRCQSH